MPTEWNTSVTGRESRTLPTRAGAPWLVAIESAATLAAAVGIGRFVLTPILPSMQAQAGVSAQLGVRLAAANHVGYLLGALATMLVPALGRSAVAVRARAVAVVASLAALPSVTLPLAWIVLRAIAGTASAIMFVAAVSAVPSEYAAASHLAGWAHGGIGAGIALSGGVVMLVSPFGDWRTAWWAAAVLGAALVALGWNLIDPDPTADAVSPVSERIARPHRWFIPLALAYFLEGVGYIVAGTFLVAAVEAAVPGPWARQPGSSWGLQPCRHARSGHG